jgi:hypothetical protein
MEKFRIVSTLAVLSVVASGYALHKGGVFDSSGESASVLLHDPIAESAEQGESEEERLARERRFANRYCEDAYAVTCARPTRATVDPTGKVDLQITGEVRALRVLRKIIATHPEWGSKQIEEELVSQIYTDKRTNRIDAAYRWVKEQLIAVINRQSDGVFSQAEKKTLLERIERVALDMPPPASKYSDAPDIFTKNAIYYERTPEGVIRLRVGGAYLMNISSWFNLVFTMAHEFAHAIDPCELSAARALPESYGRLISCFIKAGWVDPARSSCKGNEQVSETFADWLAAEAVSSALLGTAKEYGLRDRVNAAVNSVRDLCEEPVTVDVLSDYNHPLPEIRIRGVFGGNPRIRKALQCAPSRKESAKYCEFSEKGD